MKPTTWAVILTMLGTIPGLARQTTPQTKRSERSGTQGQGDARPAKILPCESLESIGAAVDRRFDEENGSRSVKEEDAILDAIDAAATDLNAKPSNFKELDMELNDPTQPDLLWDALVDCANGTKITSQRAEALRVLAVREGIRAESFAKQYQAAQPVHPDSCGNLDQLRARVEAVTAVDPSSAITHPMPDYDSTAGALWKCANDAARLSKSNPDDRYWSTVTALSLELWEAKRARTFFEQAYLNTTDYANAQAEYDARQKGGAETNEKIGTDQPAGEAANQCDQVITVAGLTPNGLALYIPPDGQRFMAKNAKDYPRMCLVERTDAESFARGVPHYLLVWAYSENAFAGFQPVQQVTTSPASGSGTATNFYGDTWNFTFTGNLTEIDTVEAPYVIQSRTLYLWAYDGKGSIVSRHSISTSSQAGGDGSYAAGYNAGALISLLWNNPSRLIKGVLKDVQKASGH